MKKSAKAVAAVSTIDFSVIRTLTVEEVQAYLGDKKGQERFTAINELKSYCMKGGHTSPRVSQNAAVLNLLDQEFRRENLGSTKRSMNMMQAGTTPVRSRCAVREGRNSIRAGIHSY